MSIEQALFAKLTTTPAVSGLIGTRLFPDEAPQGATFPLAVYEGASRQTVMTYSGPALTDRYEASISCYGLTKASARAVAKAVRETMLGLQGSTVPAANVRVLGCFDEDETTDVENPIHGDERGVFAVRMTFSLWYKPAA